MIPVVVHGVKEDGVRAAIISTGEEVLSGETTDTNSAWLAESLWAQGVEVRCMLAAGDDTESLCWALEQAASQADVVIMTGGLGPTVDDRTAEAVATWSCSTLVLHPEAMEQIEDRYRKRGVPMNEANRKQAWFPKDARVLENRWGSAPGFVIRHMGVDVFCVPGVPFEMRSMFAAHMAGTLTVEEPPTLVRIRTFGCAESQLAEVLDGVDIGTARLGFRAHIPEVQVKLLFPAATPATRRNVVVERVANALSKWVYCINGGDLAETVVSELSTARETVSVAESCTAGMTSAWIADVPGSSAVLDRGVVSYSNESKIELLGVSPQTLSEYGAVSEPVAREMAMGIRRVGHTTWGVSLTGIAGPGGGTPSKPVGTVHIAVAGPGGVWHQHAVIPGNRAQVRKRAAGAVLALLLRARRSGSVLSETKA